MHSNIKKSIIIFVYKNALEKQTSNVRSKNLDDFCTRGVSGTLVMHDQENSRNVSLFPPLSQLLGSFYHHNHPYNSSLFNTSRDEDTVQECNLHVITFQNENLNNVLQMKLASSASLLSIDHTDSGETVAYLVWIRILQALNNRDDDNHDHQDSDVALLDLQTQNIPSSQLITDTDPGVVVVDLTIPDRDVNEVACIAEALTGRLIGLIDRVLVSIVFGDSESTIHNARVAADDETNRWQNFDFKTFVPRQSWMYNQDLIQRDASGCKLLWYSQANQGNVRRDHVQQFTAQNCHRQGANKSILVDHFLREILFKIGVTPKYGA